MSQLKLSSIKANQQKAAELEQALSQIAVLNGELAAEKDASKALSLKLTEAQSNSTADRLTAENAALREEVEKLETAQQIQRLEGLVGQDAKVSKLTEQLKAKTSELSEAKRDLKKLQALDPERLKRQLADQKKRIAEQATVSKEVVKKLKDANKEISELKKALKEAESAAPAEGEEGAAAE